MRNYKTKNVRIINKKTMISSLDIGKCSHYAYFRAPNGKDIKPFTFTNYRKDFDNLWERMGQF